jgi:hypothetical protein
MMNATVPADPCLRKRALLLVLTALVMGAIFLYFFHGFLRGVKALATSSPQKELIDRVPIGTRKCGKEAEAWPSEFNPITTQEVSMAVQVRQHKGAWRVFINHHRKEQ